MRSDAISSDNRVTVVIVESHQHALEHVHDVLRRRSIRSPLLANNDFTMVHFDSHPDLACPGRHIPAAACFTPRKSWPVNDNSDLDKLDAVNGSSSTTKDLYELLDTSQSGIAEWILPLVLAGGLRTVHWVSSAWANQFQDGHYSFHVGAWVDVDVDRSNGTIDGETHAAFDAPESFLDLPEEAVVKVDLLHSYYLDDSSYVPTKELLLPKSVDLYVSTLPNQKSNAHHEMNHVEGNHQIPWSLDVCLDYFACDNPFLSDLREVDANFAKALLDVATRANFHSNSISCQEGLNPDVYQQNRHIFHKLIKQLLEAPLMTTTGEHDMESNQEKELGALIPPHQQRVHRSGQRLEVNEYNQLYNFYPSIEEGMHLIQVLEDTLLASEVPAKFVSMAVDALPNLSMPFHCEEDGIKRSAILNRLSQFKEALLESTWGAQRLDGKPFLITIARSGLDGFTPSGLVDDLQQNVLDRLHELYCGCGRMTKNDRNNSCTFQVIRDYGDWEGSSIPVQ